MEALIETERLRLRPPEPSDAQRITELIGDYDVCKMLTRVPYPYALKDAHAFLGRLAEREAAGELVLGMALPEGLIGVIGLHDIRVIEGGKIGEIGYWLGKPYWGRGLITEAARAFVRHIFEDLNFAGLISGHFKENYRSGRVLTKLGFRYAGEGFKESLSRKVAMPHVDVVLTRAQWQDFAAKRAA